MHEAQSMKLSKKINKQKNEHAKQCGQHNSCLRVFISSNDAFSVLKEENQSDIYFLSLYHVKYLRFNKRLNKE